MKLHIAILFLIFFSAFQAVGQEFYTITPISDINTPEANEYCPFYFDNSLVFCSNRKNDIMVNFHDEFQQHLTDLYISRFQSSASDQAGAMPIITAGARIHLGISKTFAQEIRTSYHEGPACITRDGKTLYFTRNIETEKTMRNFTGVNMLGIFISKLSGGVWQDPVPFDYNGDNVVSHPTIDDAGKTLYFASNRAGGFGGIDLYKCEWVDGRWSEPQNLGPQINSDRNEVFPSIHSNGRLYFSSDKNCKYKGLNIYYSQPSSQGWHEPVLLESPLNSDADDFGYIADQSGENGYFTSNRKGTDDIYSFIANVPQFTDCEVQRDPSLCGTFFEESTMSFDGQPLSYQWNLGDGTIINGLEARHCYKKPGNYMIQLNVIDTLSGDVFFNEATFNYEIEEIFKPHIACLDSVAVSSEVPMHALASKIRDFEVHQYYWDFGDGGRGIGAEVSHFYESKGNYTITLGAESKPDKHGSVKRDCIRKQVAVLDENDVPTYMPSNDLMSSVDPVMGTRNPINYGPPKLVNTPIDEDYPKDESVYRIELLSSTDRVDNIQITFNDLANNYEISEFYLEKSENYTYTIGESDNPQDIYKLYLEIKSIDKYHDVQVKRFQDEMAIAMRINEELTYFTNILFASNSYKIERSSYPILEELAEYLQKKKLARIRIGAHTDSTGSKELNDELARNRANAVVKYLSHHKIERERLEAEGYGASKPIATNQTEEGKQLNRRVELVVLND